MSEIQKSASLAQYSSFHTGGPAENLLVCADTSDLLAAVQNNQHATLTLLGFGTNVLISDKGLPGLTVVCRGGSFSVENDLVIADAGVWWDDLVLAALDKKLWGIELMSGIPSSVGGAIMGNIAAYGQQVSDTLVWIEIIDSKTGDIKRYDATDFTYSYRFNSLRDRAGAVILRAAFRLHKSPSKPLEYGSALRVADKLGLDPASLHDRRLIILEARKRAGSLYDPAGTHNTFTAGSFFKNPVVPLEVAKQVIAFDETGKSEEQLLAQNRIHGGDDHRVSAAHVLLAAGFQRGQHWGQVRLHPEHILKIENMGGASSQEIYEVGQLLISTVKQKLNVTLEPEVTFLGDFTK